MKNQACQTIFTAYDVAFWFVSNDLIPHDLIFQHPTNPNLQIVALPTIDITAFPNFEVEGRLYTTREDVEEFVARQVEQHKSTWQVPFDDDAAEFEIAPPDWTGQEEWADYEDDDGDIDDWYEDEDF